MPGRIRLQGVLIKCRLRMIRKSGMTVTWMGTISDARRSTNRPDCPGNRNRANAYPAMGAVTSIPSVVKVAMTKLLNMFRSSGSGPLIAVEKLLQLNSVGYHVGGRSYACSAVFKAVMAM